MRDQHVLAPVHVDAGDRHLVEATLRAHAGCLVRVGRAAGAVLGHHHLHPLGVRLAVMVGRRSAHRDEVVADRAAAMDDRLHHRPHRLGSAVELHDVRTAVGGSRIGRHHLGHRHDVADATGDERVAEDALRMRRHVVHRVRAPHRVARDVELVDAHRIHEVVHEVGMAALAERVRVVRVLGEPERRHVGAVHAEAVGAEERRHEAPARGARRADDAAVQQHDRRAGLTRCHVVRLGTRREPHPAAQHPRDLDDALVGQRHCVSPSASVSYFAIAGCSCATGSSFGHTSLSISWAYRR